MEIFQGAVSHLCQMVNKQLYQLIEYARRTPHFAQLQREDQITLLRTGWNELLIATVAWRSIEVSWIQSFKRIHGSCMFHEFESFFFSISCSMNLVFRSRTNTCRWIS